MSRNVEIANTILAQLGGNRFRAMTGSKDFAAIDSGIQFKVGRNGNKVNFCRVVLNEMDTYDVEYGFMRNGVFTVHQISRGVYCDRLEADFADATGMATRL